MKRNFDKVKVSLKNTIRESIQGSKTIGLDMTPYLGTTVTVHIIPVQHWKTGNIALDKNVTTYAILVQSDTRVAGA